MDPIKEKIPDTYGKSHELTSASSLLKDLISKFTPPTPAKKEWHTPPTGSKSRLPQRSISYSTEKADKEKAEKKGSRLSIFRSKTLPEDVQNGINANNNISYPTKGFSSANTSPQSSSSNSNSPSGNVTPKKGSIITKQEINSLSPLVTRAILKTAKSHKGEVSSPSKVFSSPPSSSSSSNSPSGNVSPIKGSRIAKEAENPLSPLLTRAVFKSGKHEIKCPGYKLSLDLSTAIKIAESQKSHIYRISAFKTNLNKSKSEAEPITVIFKFPEALTQKELEQSQTELLHEFENIQQTRKKLEEYGKDPDIIQECYCATRLPIENEIIGLLTRDYTGGDLYDFLSENLERMTTSDKLKLARKLIEAQLNLHSVVGYCHCDWKLENIFMRLAETDSEESILGYLPTIGDMASGRFFNEEKRSFYRLGFTPENCLPDDKDDFDKVYKSNHGKASEIACHMDIACSGMMLYQIFAGIKTKTESKGCSFYFPFESMHNPEPFLSAPLEKGLQNAFGTYNEGNSCSQMLFEIIKGLCHRDRNERLTLEKAFSGINAVEQAFERINKI